MKIFVACVCEKLALKFQLHSGNCHDAPEDRKLIESLNCKGPDTFAHGPTMKHELSHLGEGLFLLSLRIKQENHLGNMIQNLINVVTKSNGLFLYIKRFRKVFTLYDKLDTIYFSIVTLALFF